MTEAEEKKLWARLKGQADQDARNELVLHHMRTVKYIAGRIAIHVPSHVELGDLISWGTLGLLDAVDKFDPSQEIKFSTYASIRIRGSIIDQIRTLDWAPRSLRSMARQVGTARDSLRHALGREPNSDEIASQLGIAAEKVEDTLNSMQVAQMLSLDDYLPSEDSAETRKLDVVSDAQGTSPQRAAEANERQEELVKGILQLPDQQQKVLNLYYYEELTLKEIGLVLGVSESRICQVHSAAMKRLRKVVRGEE